MSEPSPSPLLRLPTVVAILAAVYFVAGKLGLLLAFVHPNATAVWPPTGIALAAFLVLGYRLWPGVFLGAFLINLTTAGAVATSLGIATGNTLEGLAGAYLVNRFAQGRQAFDRPQDVFKFAVLAGMVSTTIGATVGVTSLALGGYAPWANFGAIWMTWWLGDAGGDLIMAPLLILWSAQPRVRWHRVQKLEAFALLLIIVSVGMVVFGGVSSTPDKNYPLGFLCLPMLLWTAFRFGQRDTTTATFLLSWIAIWGTMQGFGPFARQSPNESLLLLQAFLGVSTMSAMSLASAVSERRRAEETLRESEERFRLTIDHANDAIFMKDLDGRYLAANPAALRVLHPEDPVPDKVIGKTDMDLLPRKTAEEFARTDKLLFESGKPVKRIEEEVTPDGTRMWEAVKVPYLDEQGKMRGLIGVSRDITERKRAEEEVRSIKDQLQAILDHSPAIIYVKDRKGHHLLANRQFEAQLSLTHEQIIGKTNEELFSGTTADAMRANDLKVMESGRPLQFEETLQLKDGPRTFISIKFPLRDNIGHPYALCGISTDITERKWAEEERARLLKEVQDSHDRLQRLSGRLLEVQEEERRRLARDLHDQTGQSLTSLLVGLRTLEDASTLEATRVQARNLRTITAQALDEVKRLAIGLRPALLDDLGLEAALTRLAKESAKTYGVSVDLHVKGLPKHRLPPPVETGLYRLAQEALTNTGRHAAATNGSILLTCSESSVKLIAEDNGRGFDVEKALRLPGSSNHLGLLGMRERVALLNGTISVESTPGSGTTIYVQVPLEARPS